MPTRGDGSRVGRYEISAELGRGSMGVVHLAYDPLMQRDVAVKTIYLPRGMPQDQRDEFQQRFLYEAQTTGCLTHPGIVAVYDFDRNPDDGLPFIAMEYVAGRTLHELLDQNGALDFERAFSLTDALADALQSAHAAGIVHQDIKPANILIRDSDGTAKIADFGVARMRASDFDDEGPIYGSPAYMAPERIQGVGSDARGDLFSLAVIFYEMLTGERPFSGDDPASLSYAITREPPVPITRRSPALAPGLDRFFERALAKKPCDRFPDAATFRQELGQAYRDQDRFANGCSTMQISQGRSEVVADPSRARTAAPRPGGIPRRWLLIGPIACALVVLSFAFGWSSRGRRPPDAATRPSAERQPALTTPTRLLVAPVSAADDGVSGFIGMGPTSPAESSAVPAQPEPEAATDRSVEIEKVTPVVPSRPEAVPSPSVEPAAQPEALAADTLQEDVVDPSFEPVIPPAVVHLSIRSSVRSGTLTVLVDDTPVFTAELSGESGRFARFYKKALNRTKENIQEQLELPAGPHKITVVLEIAGKDRRYEQALEADFETGVERTIQIVAGRSIGKRLVARFED